MLTHIDIRDLVTIEELNLELSHGCTMITGETGSGKSIFIEAIELGLGGRSHSSLVRSGKEKAEITLSFDIKNFPKVLALLESLDLTDGHYECIIRRIILADGKSRSYVNGRPQNLQLVRDLGELLFHLHSQHEQQVLLKPDTQREMLDRYALSMDLANQVRVKSLEIKQTEKDINDIQQASYEKQKRIEYLQFQLDELNTVSLKPGEWHNLIKEHERLLHSESLLEALLSTLLQLEETESPNATGFLVNSRKILESLTSIEPKSMEWKNQLESILIQLRELITELKSYSEDVENNPQKLQLVESQVSHIFDLSRKHKIDPEELMGFKASLEEELTNLKKSDQAISELKQRNDLLKKEYETLASHLSSTRLSAAERFSKEVTETIRSLSLPHGEFKILLEKEVQPFSQLGLEKINFLIKINPDQELMPLVKVISGGELSRLSLAAHLALANKTTIPTLIFDEVDTGLGGATAEKIGRLLRQLGKSYQVFCITHQPQVAACGQHHLLVKKHFIHNKTHTRLGLLSEKEKANEIARMLAGETITSTSLKHAKEIMIKD